MHVLITGGAGFIGSHLAEALLARGDSVAALDDLSTGNFQHIAHLRHHPNFSFAIESVHNGQVLDRLASQADAIVHLAAAVGVQLVVEKPTETIETNVLGTDAVLRTARRYRCRTLIASTSEVYGKNPKPVWSEDDDLVLGPTTFSRWSYGASKAIDEFLALGYWREYDLPIVVGRFFNVVGPRQSGAYGMVLPRFVEAARNGGTLIVHDDGQQTRCFAPVQEVVKALAMHCSPPVRLRPQ